jgi:hypothetical protein
MSTQRMLLCQSDLSWPEGGSLRTEYVAFGVFIIIIKALYNAL